MDIVDFFLGNALNAVDAKGRVSLPSDFRVVVERRARAAVAEGIDLSDKRIAVGEHESAGCLQAFDATYEAILHRQLQQRVAQGGGDQMAALDDVSLDAFGAISQVNFDAAGRMVLSGLLRATADITDLAFFVGAGHTFQIWNPHRFLEEQAGKERVCRQLRYLLQERGVKA